MAVYRITCKQISTGSKTFFNNAWFCRGFVSATTPCQEAKVDKETVGKMLETVETVKDGAKDVVKVATNTTGNVAAHATERSFDHASKKVDGEKSKDVLDTGKVAAGAVKDKTEENKD